MGPIMSRSFLKTQDIDTNKLTKYSQKKKRKKKASVSHLAGNLFLYLLPNQFIICSLIEQVFMIQEFRNNTLLVQCGCENDPFSAIYELSEGWRLGEEGIIVGGCEPLCLLGRANVVSTLITFTPPARKLPEGRRHGIAPWTGGWVEED